MTLSIIGSVNPQPLLLRRTYGAVEARSSEWSRWIYRVSQATSTTFTVLGAVMWTVRPLDRYVASESIAASSLSGFQFFVNSWAVHVGVLDLQVAERLDDSEGKLQAASKISVGSLGIAGSIFPMFCTVARQVKWYIPVAAGAGLGAASFGCFAAASFLHMIESGYNTWQCHQLRAQIQENPEQILEQWRHLLKETDPKVLERGMEEWRRYFGIDGLKRLVENRDSILDPDFATSAKMQELCACFKNTLFRNEWFYAASTAMAALGLVILILCFVYSGGWIPVALVVFGAILGAIVGIASRLIPRHMIPPESCELEMQPLYKEEEALSLSV